MSKITIWGTTQGGKKQKNEYIFTEKNHSKAMDWIKKEAKSIFRKRGGDIDPRLN
jgi:hypothetical protein